MTDIENNGLIPAAYCPGNDPHSIAQGLYQHYAYTLAQGEDAHIPSYLYEALALLVRDRLVVHWKETQRRYKADDVKRVSYLSLEFLMGRSLTNAVYNLDLEESIRAALAGYGMSLEDTEDEEKDAGLGNGGLGRLAACFLDSCASLKLPVTGYGIRYEYGMFRQAIEGGEQVEYPDHWLRDGNPWEMERAEDTRRVKFYGHTESEHDGKASRWLNTHDVLALPYDIPVPGYRNNCVNTLRLWKAAATEEFDLGEFNAGSYPESVEAKNEAEHITMVLYPNDASENGKQLRLRQQYFLASASLQDVLARWVEEHGEDFSNFAAKNCFQLNDTHPSCAVAELMRLLMDEHGMDWNEAWGITSQCMAYTNHTLLPEALERWSVKLFSHMLPRLMEIIYEINGRLLTEISQRWPGDYERQRRMSLIEEGHDPQIRMAYLALVGSFSVNGVAALHTKLLKSDLFKDWYELWPDKFNNKTNGVTQRRWLAHCNPGLREHINRAIGDDWLIDLEQLERLGPMVEDPAFCEQWHTIKQANKQRLVDFVQQETGVRFDVDSMFDVQVKRIHEYKRQLLNVLHVIHLYDRILRGEGDQVQPRSVLIGGKAAPGYAMAKMIIKLVNNVASVIDANPVVKERLQLVFVPNYRVTAMEIICPATDLSEQVSTAGKEASGTGNMKFMMNGAMTIGTLDGANIEMLEQVGEENFFLFGLDAEAVVEVRKDYDPSAIIDADADFKRVMSLLEGGHFNASEPGIFDTICCSIRDRHDQWVTAADFRSYVDAQARAAGAYQDRQQWTRMSIRNTAASGFFSSDRTIQQYAEEIWDIPVETGASKAKE